VFERTFPDPFVLKFGSVFYGHATGRSINGDRVFSVIQSADLIEWEDTGAAMVPKESGPPLYWAPEVTYSQGRFYLYSSCGNEINMELRIAVSDRPDSGFVDSGIRLTDEQFAIDPHVFIDNNGEKYLLYATDFLEHSHIGTGTVVDRMLDWFRLEGRHMMLTL
jgi:arabinan endo-1,5-alpha-L-arabinosidase